MAKFVIIFLCSAVVTLVSSQGYGGAPSPRDEERIAYRLGGDDLQNRFSDEKIKFILKSPRDNEIDLDNLMIVKEFRRQNSLGKFKNDFSKYQIGYGGIPSFTAGVKSESVSD